MEIQNDGVASLTHGEQVMPQVRPHVFEVPPELGEHLLRFPHQGWRDPDPVEPVFVPVPVPVYVHPSPEGVREVPDADDLQDAPVDDGGANAPAEAPQAVQEPPVAADAVPRVTVADALVALALAGGADGVTSAHAVEVMGRQAYTLLGVLAEDGRLIKAGRGHYLHPDFA